MSIRIIRILVLHTLFTVFSINSFALSLTNIPDIEIDKAQIITPKQDAARASLKMTIYNRSDQPLIIKGVSSQQFEKAVIHKTQFESGERQMYRVDQLSVKAHSQLALTPNTAHIMLFDPKQPLKTGEIITIDLETSQGRLPVVARVSSPGTR